MPVQPSRGKALALTPLCPAPGPAPARRGHTPALATLHTRPVPLLGRTDRARHALGEHLAPYGMHRGLYPACKRRLRPHLAAVRRAVLQRRSESGVRSDVPALTPGPACFARPDRTVFAVLHL